MPIVCAYLAFAAIVLATAYGSRLGLLVGVAVPAGVGVSVAAWMRLRRHGPDGTGPSAGDKPAGPRRAPELVSSASST